MEKNYKIHGGRHHAASPEEKVLRSMRKTGFTDAGLTTETAKVLLRLWKRVNGGCWPHLQVTRQLQGGPSCLLNDCRRGHAFIGSRFDMPGFDCFVGLVMPQENHPEQVYISVVEEDHQTPADILREPELERLRQLLRRFRTGECRLDFECENFFVCRTPHARGRAAYERLLDVLESQYVP